MNQSHLVNGSGGGSVNLFVASDLGDSTPKCSSQYVYNVRIGSGGKGTYNIGQIADKNYFALFKRCW